MKIDAILDEIRSLACSQGFYGRLYRSLMEICHNSPDDWDCVVAELEAQHFGDTLDLVLYFET